MLARIQEIRDAQADCAVPINHDEFEELSFYKRALFLGKLESSDSRVEAIQAIEQIYRIQLVDTLLTAETLPGFLEELDQRSWWSKRDIYLLSYAYQQLDEEQKETILVLITKKGINIFDPKPEYLVGEEQMVKGLRVDQVRPVEEGKFIEHVRVNDIQWGGHTEQTEQTPKGPGRPRKSTIAPRIRVDTEHEVEADTIVPVKPDEQLLNYKAFSQQIDSTYWDSESTSSLALDVIAVYLKGQKILYIEAKTHCERNLTLLMLPAIFISALCTVLSVSIDPYSWGPILVSSLTALNSFLLTLVNYLKLDARAEAHRVSSYQFDKLQTLCEFQSGKVLFFRDQKAIEVVTDIEKKIKEIKDNNQFIIPETVRDRFPLLYNTNVFTEVKRIENKETMLKHQMIAEGDKAKKEKLLESYMNLRDEYMKLDTIFNTEIQREIDRRGGCCRRNTAKALMNTTKE